LNYNKIEVTPNDINDYKTVKINCNAEFKPLSNFYNIKKVIDKNPFDIKDEDKWYYYLPSVNEISYPNHPLEYLDKFNIYDESTITIEDGEKVLIRNIGRRKPPTPIIKIFWHDDHLDINIVNYNEKYITRVIIDGTLQKNNNESNLYSIYNEGTHIVYIEYVDEETLEMSYITKRIEYEKKYKVPAPNIMHEDSKATIFYHPESQNRENYYKIGNNEFRAKSLKEEIVLNNNETVTAYTINTDLNDKLLYEASNSFPEKISEKCTLPNTDSNWKDTYNDYKKYNKLWNIEYMSLPEIRELNKGHEYFENYVKVFKNISLDDISIKPEIIGLNSKDNVFSCFPHVKRYPGCNYYSYLNRDIYELGQPIDNIYSPIRKNIDLIVGCEYQLQNDGEIRRSETRISDAMIDTTFPAYPKLTEDIESIMVEPFEIDIIREKDVNGEYINYKAKLNNEEWNLDKKVKDRYILEDGEYMLDMFAFKKSNGTFRHRSSYFTINTFQHVPLQPLKTKIVPLKITNSPTTGTEGELVLDSNSGHYGVVRKIDGDNKICSPTCILSSELLKLEEMSNDISKMYLNSKNRLNTLLERYNINSENMINVFSGENWDNIKESIIDDEITEIYTEIGILKKSYNGITCIDQIGKNKTLLGSFIIPRIKNLSIKVDECKNILEDDKKSAFRIVRNLILLTFSELREIIRENYEFGENLKNYLDLSFEEYKQKEIDKFNAIKTEIEKGDYDE